MKWCIKWKNDPRFSKLQIGNDPKWVSNSIFAAQWKNIAAQKSNLGSFGPLRIPKRKKGGKTGIFIFSQYINICWAVTLSSYLSHSLSVSIFLTLSLPLFLSFSLSLPLSPNLSLHRINSSTALYCKLCLVKAPQKPGPFLAQSPE